LRKTLWGCKSGKKAGYFPSQRGRKIICIRNFSKVNVTKQGR
jgi:hypothetical protein